MNVELRPFGKCHCERLAIAYDLQQAPVRMSSTLTHSGSPTGTVEDTIKLACTLIKRRKCTSKDMLQYKCSVNNAQTRWSVANQASSTMLPSVSGDSSQAANGMFLDLRSPPHRPRCGFERLSEPNTLESYDFLLPSSSSQQLSHSLHT